MLSFAYHPRAAGHAQIRECGVPCNDLHRPDSRKVRFPIEQADSRSCKQRDHGGDGNRKIENNDLKQNHNFYDINDKRVKNVIKRSTNKGMLKLNLIESFGRIDGLELFNRLEKDFRPRKRV